MTTSYTLQVFDIDIAFKADANTEDLDNAKELLETRAEQLKQQGKAISKEKMLLFLSLGLAYDLLQANAQLNSIQRRLEDMLTKVEGIHTVIEEDATSTDSEDITLPNE
ncbi:MAG: cell division protein ZapA [Desulfovibrionaceae bacterium]|nr:cell division protein ZapA [Desulfovibrionaceae bacterium]